MKKLFRVQRHEDHGDLGLIETTAPPEFFPLQGMGIAHDCLEHFPGDDGSIDHEFMALGAMIWIRGDQGYFLHQPTEANLSVEMSAMLWRYFYYDSYTMRPPKPGNRLEICSVVIGACKLATNEILYDFDIDEISDKLKEFMASARYWLQVGYNRAKKRYPRPDKAVSVFRIIEEQVNNILDFETVYEGQEVEIQYCVSKCTANVKVIPDPYEYDY